MRDVPSTINQAWLSGQMTGPARPMGRVTVQRAKMSVYDLSFNLYASAIFDNFEVPKELPNVKSISWDRSIDADVATCTIEFYNTKALPLGQPPVGTDRDLPGFYTPTYGLGTFSSRWEHEPNEWQGLLLPDNILRTFEGYGFDPDVCPEKDPFLVQTGVWMIDDVQITSAGTIVASCRDLGRLLIDHIAMQPVVPDAFHPLEFEATGRNVGIQPPQFKSWGGGAPDGAPNDVPGNVQVTPQRKGFDLSWDPVPAPAAELTALPPEAADGTAYRVPGATSADDRFYVRFAMGANAHWRTVVGDFHRWAAEYLYGPWVDITAGQVGNILGPFEEIFDGELHRYVPEYEVVGYRVYVNDTVQSRTLDETQTSASFGGLTDGVVYNTQVAAIYEDLDSGNRFTADRSAPQFFSPRYLTSVAVHPLEVEPDTREDGTPADGWIRWKYDATEVTAAEWTIILFKGEQGRLDRKVFTFTKTVFVGDDWWQEFDTGVSDLNVWNILVFPEEGDRVGAGGMVLSSDPDTLGFYGTSGEPGTPAPPPAADGRALVVGTDGQPAETSRYVPTYRLDSNHPYVGTNGAVYGHRGSDAFDSDPGSYWLSVGNSRPDVGYAFEWVEGDLPNIAVAQAEVLTHYTNMMCWVSIMVDGKWLAHEPGDVIPYDPDHPLSRNGGNIGYVHAEVVPGGSTPHLMRLRQVYGDVQRVRFTFSNLNDSDLGQYQYRAAVKEVAVYAVQTDAKPAPSTPSDTVTDATGADIVNARFVTGAGAHPGTYDDYTDIVKLLCAWGGFFWPEDGVVMGCDGVGVQHSFGNAPYNLGPNIDPVLGAPGGRVWGDFEQAGTAGVATLTPSIFDKQPLMAGINHVKDILGFLFFIDEDGAVVWRAPNIFKVGNFKGNRTAGASRTAATLVVDEKVNLLDLGVTLTSRNVREKIFVGSPDASLAGVASGWNPNPVGLRRVAGWTDQRFETQAECQLMAEMIALRQLFTYRTNRIQIPANPRIQIDDQIAVFERTTSEGYRHYVKSINSTLDMESGEWTYTLGTHWLGEDPQGLWAFDPWQLSALTTGFLVSTGRLDKPGSRNVQRQAVPSSYTFDEWVEP